MNKNQTLTQIEGKDWGPPAASTFLVTECHRLRHVPLELLTPENLRILIGQSVSLSILVPLAMEVLESDPLTECDFYPGDLLEAVKGCPPEFWAGQPQLMLRLEAVLEAASRAEEEE